MMCWISYKCLQSERLLRDAEMCRRLETEEEKVLPYYATSLSKEELQDVADAVAQTPTEPLVKVRDFKTCLLMVDLFR